jgi:trehalose-phosphatase
MTWIGKAENFLHRVENCPASLLMIDYDGTLAPLKRERDKAFPDPRLLEKVQRLMDSQKCRVVIVSGRQLKDLVLLLGMATPPELWGSHGLERRGPAGEIWSFALPEKIKVILQQEEGDLSSAFPGALESKPCALAFHWRGASPEEAEHLENMIRKRWKRFSEGLEVRPFDGGLELRPQGKGKGDVVCHILKQTDPSVPCAYIGDDLTDEDAFAALGDRGIKILLRHHTEKTLADIEMSPEKLCDFLQQWTEKVCRE